MHKEPITRKCKAHTARCHGCGANGHGTQIGPPQGRDIELNQVFEYCNHDIMSVNMICIYNYRDIKS